MSRRVPFLAARLAGISYFAQGIGPGLVQGIILPNLAAQGLPIADQAWLLGAGTLPWVLKLLWAVQIDGWLGRTHAAVIRVAAFATAGMGLCVSAWAVLAPENLAFGAILAIWALHGVLASLQDTACDAALLDLTEQSERPTVQATGFLSRHIGQAVIVTMGLGAMTAQGYGAQATAIAAGLLLVGAFAIARLRKYVSATPREYFSISRLAQWKRLATPAWGRHAWVAITGLLVYGGFDAISGAFLFQELHWQVADYQTQLVPLATGMSVIGYLLSTTLGRRFRAKGFLLIGGCGLIGAWLVLAALSPWWQSLAHPMILGFAAVEAIFAGIYLTGLHSILMTPCEGALRATQFAALMTLLNVSRVFGLSMMATLSQTLRFPELFTLGAIVQALWLVVCCKGIRPATLAAKD